MVTESVSAALIVRDEEAFLEDCLASLKGQVDEILVVDTGSRDQSIEIARRHDARILHFKWSNDFAQARNYALEACRTNWCLYIDADERLLSPSQAPIGETLDRGWIAADILMQPKANYTRYRLTRLFRLSPCIRFEGPIHETILPSLAALQQRGGSSLAIGLTDLRIDHLGYADELVRSKLLRNLPLLQECVKRSPQRVYLWFHLAETLFALTRFSDAHEAAMRGIAIAERTNSRKDAVDGAMICQILSVQLIGQGVDPLALIQKGLTFDPANPGLRLTLARRELSFGDPRNSLEIATSLRQINPDSLEPDLMAFDRDIFGRYAVEMQIASLTRLERFRDAAELIARSAPLLSSGITRDSSH